MANLLKIKYLRRMVIYRVIASFLGTINQNMFKLFKQTPLEWQNSRALRSWKAIHFFSSKVKNGRVLIRS